MFSENNYVGFFRMPSLSSVGFLKWIGHMSSKINFIRCYLWWDYSPLVIFFWLMVSTRSFFIYQLIIKTFYWIFKLVFFLVQERNLVFRLKQWGHFFNYKSTILNIMTWLVKHCSFFSFSISMNTLIACK